MSHVVRDISGAVGASVVATATDGLVFFGLHIGADLPAWIAALSAAASGGIVHYALSRFAVFQRFEASLPQSAAKYILMSSAAAVVYAVGTELTVPIMGATAAWLTLKVLIFAAITYPLSRYWVFGQRQPLVCDEAP